MPPKTPFAPGYSPSATGGKGAASGGVSLPDSTNHWEDTMTTNHDRPTTNLLVVQLDEGGPLNVSGDAILVVAPALNSRLRRWISDEDDARRAAEDRLAGYLAR